MSAAMIGKRILIVDDDASFATTLARALGRHGHVVQVAANGAAALATAVAACPDAVLVDLRLGSENGLQLVQDLRQQLGKARIVMLTGFGSIATAVEAIKRGADDYRVKPASLTEIIAALALAEEATGAGSGAEAEQPLDAEPLNLRQLSWEHIQRVLVEQGGNVSAAARALGMHRRTLQRKLAKAPRPR